LPEVNLVITEIFRYFFCEALFITSSLLTWNVI